MRKVSRQMPTRKRPAEPPPPQQPAPQQSFDARGGYEELPWTDEDEAITARVFEELRRKEERAAQRRRPHPPTDRSAR